MVDSFNVTSLRFFSADSATDLTAKIQEEKEGEQQIPTDCGCLM